MANNLFGDLYNSTKHTEGFCWPAFTAEGDTPTSCASSGLSCGLRRQARLIALPPAQATPI